MGYPDGTKGYKLYNPVSCMFLRSCDVVFLEREFHDFDCKDSGTSVFDCMLKNHVEVEAHDNSGEQDQGHLEEHGEDVEPLHLEKHMKRTSSGMRNSWERKDSESPQQDLTRSVMWPVI